MIGRAGRCTRSRGHVLWLMIAQTCILDDRVVDYVQIAGSIGAVERGPLVLMLLLILLHLCVGLCGVCLCLPILGYLYI